MYSVKHTQIGSRPFWYLLDRYSDIDKAMHRARNYALDHGGYVCVKDDAGTIVYGTDPDALDHAITSGINRTFLAASTD